MQHAAPYVSWASLIAHLDRAKLESKIRTETGDYLQKFFRANGFKIDRIERLFHRAGKTRDYAVFLKLDEFLRRDLGLNSDELLCLVLHHRQQERWFLPEIRRLVKKYDRISKTAVLIASADSRIREFCREAYANPETGYKTAHVALSFDELTAVDTDETRCSLLLTAFHAQAFAVDHFDTRSPVPDDLFGRTQLLSQIEAEIRTASEGVAILGIRRVGKTSVMKRVVAQLRVQPDNAYLVGEYDAQEDGALASSTTAINGLIKTLRETATDHDLVLPEPDTTALPQQSLRELIDRIVRESHARVLLVMDEIEWLVPTPGTARLGEQNEQYLQLFGLLRSLKQRYPRDVAILVCGINETFSELPSIGGRENPSLDWYRAHYVRPLSKETSEVMLQDLGDRAGVSLSNEFAAMVWDKFGGHPYLARQFCSVAAKRERSRPVVLEAACFGKAYRNFAKRSFAVFSAILQNLARFYPDEYALLGRVAGSTAMSSKSSSGLSHLIAYGLVSEVSEDLVRPAMAALSEFVTEHGVEEIQRDRFRYLQVLGEGTAGKVWRAWDIKRERICAVKLYKPTAPSRTAEKEFEILHAVNGGFTPEPYELTREGDLDALVMELVEGDSLATLLETRVVVVGGDLVALSANLFAAIESLHPDHARIAELKARSTTSEEDWNELQRHLQGGFLHRDIKPNNIIVRPDDGWKVTLIDLQLAKNVLDVRSTQVGTPAYLPPDWAHARWDTSFDLYGIACILFECVIGEPPVQDSFIAKLTDAITDPDFRQVTTEFFETGLAPQASQRFQSVVAMRSEWDTACIAFV